MNIESSKTTIKNKTNLLDFSLLICHNALVKRSSTLATQSRIVHPKGWNMTNVDNRS